MAEKTREQLQEEIDALKEKHERARGKGDMEYLALQAKIATAEKDRMKMLKNVKALHEEYQKSVLQGFQEQDESMDEYMKNIKVIVLVQVLSELTKQNFYLKI